MTVPYAERVTALDESRRTAVTLAVKQAGLERDVASEAAQKAARSVARMAASAFASAPPPWRAGEWARPAGETVLCRERIAPDVTRLLSTVVRYKFGGL